MCDVFDVECKKCYNVIAIFYMWISVCININICIQIGFCQLRGVIAYLN